MAFHLGAAYRPISQWDVSAEGVYPQTGLASAHFGVEWRPIDAIAIRTGYRTDTVKELGFIAGYTVGLGIHAYGQEFAYAWLPLGDLGNTHYFSLVLRLGEAGRARRNLIQYQNIKRRRAVQGGTNDLDTDCQQLMEIYSNEDSHLAQSIPSKPSTEKQP